MSDDIGSTFLKIWVAKALEGESQISENIKWDRETKAAVPLAQARTMAIGITALIIGLVLFGWNIAWLFELTLTAGDILLLGIAGILALLIIAGLLRFVFGWHNATMRLMFAAFLLVLLSIGIAAAITSTRERFGWLNVISLGAVPVILIPGAALTYRQLLDLVDPFGKTSPVERMMRPHIPGLFSPSQQEEDAQRLRVPYRINGQMPTADNTTGGDDDDNQPDGTLYHLHPDDANFIDFIREAGKRGLGRRKWIHKRLPPYVLPTTGTEVGRDTFDDLIGQAIEWGFVAPGGDGKRTHWLRSYEDALATIESQIIAQLGEESD